MSPTSRLRTDCIERAEAKAGAPISILINNAGIHLKKPAVDTGTSEFDAILRTHVLGAHALSAAVLPGMLARGHGNILFIASMASLFGIPMVLAYSAAKSAYIGMVRSLASEVSGQGVRVERDCPRLDRLENDAQRPRKRSGAL